MEQQLNETLNGIHEEETGIFRHGRIFMHYLIAIMFQFIHYANAVIIRKMKELGLLQNP